MAQHKGIAVGSMWALLSALLPVCLVLIVAWQLSLRDDQQRLDNLTELLFKREEQAIFQATQVLKMLSATQVRPCSARHVNNMRQLTVDTPTLDEIIYHEQGQVRCSIWGDESHALSRWGHTSLIAPNHADAGIVMSIIAARNHGRRVLSLRHGNYDALINLSRFVDVLTEQNVTIGLATASGDVLEVSSGNPPDILRHLLRQTSTHTADGYLYSVRWHQAWTFAAVLPMRGFWQYVQDRQQALWPAALLLGLFVFFIVLRQYLKRVSPLADLRMAIRRREFEVHYQPIISLADGRCCGAEALLRWRRIDGTLTGPDMFVPLAEQRGLIRAITEQLIDTVLRDLGEALRADRSMHVALNLYAGDVSEGSILSVIDHELVGKGILPEQIWLEITERGLLDVESARVLLAEARTRGFVVAIDDFGTGYSNLQYLQNLPLDVLKVDRSFARAIGTGAVPSLVMPHIIEIGKSLQLTLVAEGVETRQQAAYLAERGVQYAQGWLYAKALPPADFLRFCQARKKTEPTTLGPRP